MTAPAEDPRSGEACPVKRTVYGRPCDGPGTYYCDSDVWGSACRRYFETTPPAAGRGDTDSGGERVCDRRHVHGGDCYTAPEGDAARPVREPWRVGEHYGIHVYCGDRPIATFHRPQDAAHAVAAVNELLDAQAAVNRVEALHKRWSENGLNASGIGAIGALVAANELRRALDGTT